MGDFVKSLLDNREISYTNDELRELCLRIGRCFVQQGLIKSFFCVHKEDGLLHLVLWTNTTESIFSDLSAFLRTKGVIVEVCDFILVPHGAASSHAQS